VTDLSGAATPTLEIDERLADVVGVELGEAVTASRDGDGALCLDVPAPAWQAAAIVLRDVVGLDFIDWLSAVDQPDADPPGLDIVLHVADTHRSPGSDRLRRVLLRTRITDADGRIASLTSVWPGVAWHERETFEMFGVQFEGFDDGSGRPLRPLLLPEGFEGNPLRKSFVLAARAGKSWPGAKEPGESDSHAAPSRRKTLPPGVPDPASWPRLPDDDFNSPPPVEPDVAGPDAEAKGDVRD
jgi:NADH-quinone oxidoreductase subunit C